MFNALKARLFPVAGLISTGVVAISLITTELFANNEIKNLQKEKTLETIAFGNVLHSHVDRELNALLFISGGLSSYIRAYHAELDDDKLNTILADLYSSSKHVRNMAVAIGYQTVYVHPIKGNEKALGLNYQSVPAQLEKVEQAIATKKGVLDGPLTLVQGGQALIYRYPIFIDNTYWGIISTVINTPSFFASAFSELTNQPYEFAIRKIKDSGEMSEVFHGNAKLFSNNKATIVTSVVPNAKWQWAIINNNNYRIEATALIIRLLGWLLSFGIGLIVYLLLRERARLAKTALHDDLTGLANRRLLVDRIERDLRSFDRVQGQTCSVFFFDLNGFKRINDTYGHNAGDVVLRAVAKRVSQQVRNRDTVARIGGDEFVVVVHHEKDSSILPTLEQRLRTTILQPIAFKGHQLKVGTSIGIATYPQDGTSSNELIEAADVKMYAEKKNRHETKNAILLDELVD